MMKALQRNAIILSRVLVALIFLLSGFGVVDQTAAVHQMVARGIPTSMAPTLSILGRIVEILAGLGLSLGKYQGLCSAALIAFLIPATLIAHPFWIAEGQSFQIQLINFLKNISMIGGLLFIASGQADQMNSRFSDTESN